MCEACHIHSDALKLSFELSNFGITVDILKWSFTLAVTADIDVLIFVIKRSDLSFVISMDLRKLKFV